ncbi:hypothetical protein Tco_1340678 [Tanacetum coccineum]
MYTMADVNVDAHVQQALAMAPPARTDEQILPRIRWANLSLEERMDKQGSRLYKLKNLDIPHQVSKAVDEIVTDTINWALQAPLKDRFRDLPEADMKEILYHRMWESNSYQAHEDHKKLYEALENTAVPSSSKTAASTEYTVWTTTDTRIKLSVSSTPEELHMDDDTTADEQAYSSGGEDIGRDHIPTSIPSSDLTVPKNNWASALTSTYAPPPENSLLAQTGDMATFMDWYCKRQGITELTQKDLEGPAYEIVKVFHPNVIHLQFQMEECHKLLTDQVDDAILRYNVSKPLPLGGEPGHVTIQPDFFFNKDLEYLRYGRKIGRPALSISKMKAAYYPDVGLEQMVPDQMWIEEECKYDIAAMYVFSLYGYDYMKKIILRPTDLKEYIIAERDFKYLYPSDFEDLYLLNLQGHQNHLSPEDKKILTTAVNL